MWRRASGPRRDASWRDSGPLHPDIGTVVHVYSGPQRCCDESQCTREQAIGPLAPLIERIDRGELAEAMLRSFRTEIPGYARLPDSAVRGQVLGVIRQNLDLCLDWVAGGGAPDPARFEDFSASAKDRATEGMPLEDLLRVPDRRDRYV